GQVVLPSDLAGIFGLLATAAQECRQACRRKGICYSYFALAYDLGPGDGSILFVENADGSRGKEKSPLALFCWVFAEALIVFDDGRNNAGRPVSGRSDHTSAGGVFFVYSDRIYVDPIHHVERIH